MNWRNTLAPWLVFVGLCFGGIALVNKEYGGIIVACLIFVTGIGLMCVGDYVDDRRIHELIATNNELLASEPGFIFEAPIGKRTLRVTFAEIVCGGERVVVDRSTAVYANNFTTSINLVYNYTRELLVVGGGGVLNIDFMPSKKGDGVSEWVYSEAFKAIQSAIEVKRVMASLAKMPIKLLLEKFHAGENISVGLFSIDGSYVWFKGAVPGVDLPVKLSHVACRRAGQGEALLLSADVPGVGMRYASMHIGKERNLWVLKELIALRIEAEKKNMTEIVGV